MLHFDGNHTLKSVFHSRQEAGYYVGAALRLHRVVIEVEDTSNLGNGAYNMAQLRRLYAVRLMGAANVRIAILVHAFTRLTGMQEHTTGHRIFDGMEILFAVGSAGLLSDSLATFWEKKTWWQRWLDRRKAEQWQNRPRSDGRTGFFYTGSSSSSHGRPAPDTMTPTPAARSAIWSRLTQPRPAAGSGETTGTVEGRGGLVNLQDDCEEMNKCLHRGFTMRQCLAVAHLRKGWPILDSCQHDEQG
ncbi:hypothetical protein PI124_g20469 [Phytophthora idaei]|nr:hypothetical protein PI125_g13324 [Phytophthora idaei]KAG3150693.1 hypothetical protein PI126_g11368 [Phytophthora idaei]KAG3234474.1 hypothetical protein PI124_g20469 [Phytophthora idaei]